MLLAPPSYQETVNEPPNFYSHEELVQGQIQHLATFPNVLSVEFYDSNYIYYKVRGKWGVELERMKIVYPPLMYPIERSQ